MKTHTSKFYKKLMSGTAAALILTALFLLSRPIDQETVDEIVDSFLRIKHAEAAIDSGILQLRNSMYHSYDSVDAQFEVIRNEIKSLRSKKGMMSIIKDTPIEISINNYEYLLGERILLVNKFKMHDAVLKNSLLQLAKFRKHYVHNRIPGSDVIIENMMQDILSYSSAYDEKTGDTILRDAEKLINRYDVDEGENRVLTDFVYHVRNIVSSQKELNSIMEKLLNRGPDRNIDPILINFKNLYNRWNYYTGIYRLVLYVFSVMMFLYTGFIMLKLYIARQELARSNTFLASLNESFVKFVPVEFLQMIGRENISQVSLGDYIKRDMAVLFSDIRSFTSMSEMMTPEENFEFINTYLGRMGPVIRKNNGFIDKYIGDAIMALFSGDVDDAVGAAVEMISILETMCESGEFIHPVKIGIGIHFGSMMLGTIGEQNRMEGTVISDAVNLASRVENLTKKYSINIIITEDVFSRLSESKKEFVRFIDYVKVKGKEKPIRIYEVFENDPPEIQRIKKESRNHTEKGIHLLRGGYARQAEKLFDMHLGLYPGDTVIRMHKESCTKELADAEMIHGSLSMKSS